VIWRNLPHGTPVTWSLVAARANSDPQAFDPESTLLAGFGRRFAALMIDWALCLLLGSLVGDPRGVAWPPVAILVLMNTLFIGLFGQTPGMMLAGIRCVSIDDGGAIGLAKGLLRAVLLALLVPAVIMDKARRGWHDRLAGSVVVLRPPR
jgi:uncharacterized RDD family membrane protein YckC